MMKKLFSALLILISINCFSQTTGFFRYDTVRIQKVGANSTLIIENATRDSLGFLYNYGGGRTKFEVIRAVPGGIKVGNDTIINDQSGACEDMLLSPGYVTYSGTGLKFYISNAIYRIGCVVYTTAYDSVTLSASDPDDPRKDVIYAATTGIEVLTGTPAGPAAEPQLDAGQLKLTVVDIPALATTPGLTQNIIWDENTESVVTNVGTTTDPDNLTNVYHLTKSINVTNIGTGDQIILTLPSTINAASFDALSLFIKAKALISNSTTSIRITFFNSTTAVSSEITLGHDATSLDYRGISIPISRFQFNNTFFDKIRIRWISSAGVHAGFYLDYVYLVSGLPQPGGSGTPLTIGPIDTKISSQNGAVIENNVFYNQTASQTNPGLLSPADKTKLDSIRHKYFLVNGDEPGNTLLLQVNDSTAKARRLIFVGADVDSTDESLTVTITGGGGGGNNIYNIDSTLASDRTITLAGNYLRALQGVGEFLLIDPTTNNETVVLQAINTTGTGNTAGYSGETTATNATSIFGSSFNGSSTGTIQSFSDVTGSMNSYSANMHEFTGDISIANGYRLKLGSNAGDLGSPANGNMFYNSTTNKFRAYENGAWIDMIGGTSNLLFDSLGAAGISPMTTWNNTLYARRISVSGGSIDTTASGGLLITLPAATYTFSTGLTEAAGTVTNNLSTGVSGGQTIIGGTASANNLTYSSTSHATKGLHIFGSSTGMVFDEAGNILRIGIATAIPLYNLNVGSQFVSGRGSANPISKLTWSNNTTGSSGLGIYTSTDVLQGLFRASGPSIGTTLMGVSKNNSAELLANSGPLFLYANNQAVYLSGNSTAPTISIISAGRVGLNAITAPTAWLHLPAGTTAASTAPLKFTSGTHLTTPENGAVEYNGTHLYVTIGGVRYQLDQQTKPTLTKNATIENPGAAENIGWFRTPVAITVTDVTAVLVGSSTPSVTYQVSFGTDITSLTNVYSAGQTVTSTTTGTAASGVNDATIPANSWVRITTSAQSGTVGQISLSITYTED